MAIGKGMVTNLYVETVAAPKSEQVGAHLRSRPICSQRLGPSHTGKEALACRTHQTAIGEGVRDT
jgi:hypothetical protein